jgi:hypothetical protein
VRPAAGRRRQNIKAGPSPGAGPTLSIEGQTLSINEGSDDAQ